jgi:hypothetical protein
MPTHHLHDGFLVRECCGVALLMATRPLLSAHPRTLHSDTCSSCRSGQFSTHLLRCVAPPDGSAVVAFSPHLWSLLYRLSSKLRCAALLCSLRTLRSITRWAVISYYCSLRLGPGASAAAPAAGQVLPHAPAWGVDRRCDRVTSRCRLNSTARPRLARAAAAQAWFRTIRHCGSLMSPIVVGRTDGNNLCWVHIPNNCAIYTEQYRGAQHIVHDDVMFTYNVMSFFIIDITALQAPSMSYFTPSSPSA